MPCPHRSLAYNFFHPGVEVPLLLRYLEDKDIWRRGGYRWLRIAIFSSSSCACPLRHRWAHRDSRAFTAGWDMVPLDFGAWDSTLKEGDAGIEAVLVRGRAILEFKSMQVDRAVSRAVRIRMRTPGFGQWVGAVVNSSVQASEIGNAICQKAGAEFALIWDYDHASRGFRCSLRSDTDAVDVSALARVLGGGGHRRASGFSFAGASIEELFEYVPPVSSEPQGSASGSAGDVAASS